VFVSGKPFQPSPMFAGGPEPTRVKTFQVPHSRVGSWPYIRLGWKGLPGTIALAYYENSQLRATKSFI